MPDPPALGSDPSARSTFHSPERRIGAVAAERHLVLGVEELAACGLSPAAARHRARVGLLHRIHRGVYSVVAPEALSVAGRRRAAVLACGRVAALGARSAADQRGLRPTARAGIDVVIPHDRRIAPVAGVDLHRSRSLTAQDVEVVDGIPTTTVSRTLLDLAAIVGVGGMERALNRAEELRVFDLTQINAQLVRNPHHPGATALRAALDLYRVDAAPTESDGEVAMVELIRRAGLPEPVRQLYVDLGPGTPLARLDFAWPGRKVNVEVDGSRHRTRLAFESDRRRDALLQALGWRVLRFTARQLRNDPRGVIHVLRQVLSGVAAGEG